MEDNVKDLFTGERFVPGIDDEITIEHYQRYETILNIVKDKVVVDAACGEGYGSMLLGTTAKKVTGIDISDEAVKRANENYSSETVCFIQGDISDLKLRDNSVEVFVSFETIEHVDETLQRKFIKEVARVLKDDGLFIVSSPNKEIYSDLFNYNNEFHVHELYKQEFLDLLSSSFKYVSLYNQYLEVASIIDNNDNILDNSIYKKDTDRYISDGKYFIAVASKQDICKVDLQSVYVKHNVTYRNNMKRIIELQDEEEERNRHIAKLDIEIQDKDAAIRELQQEVEDRNRHNKKLDEDIASRDSLIVMYQQEEEKLKKHLENLDLSIEKKNTEITDYQKKIQELEVEINKITSENILKNNAINCLQSELDHSYKNIDMLYLQAKLETEKINELTNIIKDDEDLVLKEGYKKKISLLNEDLERKDTHIKNIEAELNNKCNAIDERDKVIEDKDRHISNIQPIYDRWIYKQQHGHFIKRGIKKVGTIVLPKNSERRRWAIAVSKSITKKSICPSIFPYGKWGYVHIGDVYNEIGPIEFKPVEKPLVSIIVPCYNQVDYTYRCLKSIYDNTKDISYEVILADDVSSDGTKNIGKYIKNINIIRNQKNLKFLLNCNNAAKSAKGEYILFLNNDTKVMENWLSPLVELIESKEDVGMVGSKLIYPDGRLQEAGGIIWRDKGGWNFGNGQDAELPEFNYVRETDYISGAAIMIKKSLWGDIGGFDETFAPAYCEDTDLAFEVRKHGYKVLYQPQSVVVHYEGISNGTDLTTGIKKYQVVNEEKFRSKWSEEMSKHYDNGQNPFCARERNFGDKKVVLFIDHYVPHFDKDAGSRTVFQYICLFLQKGYIVKFIGDNYFKHEPYTTMLNQLGVEVLHGPWYANNIDKWFDENMKYINYVFTNRPHISVKYIDKLREFPNVRIMYYGHDLHFMRMEREYEITGEPLLLTESKEWKNKELSIMRNVDVVYYLSTLEKTVINDIDPSINVKNIMVNVFEKFQTNINYDFSKRNGILFVGGFAHTPNIDAILWFVNNVFPKILDKKKIKLFVVGSHAPQEVLDLANEDIIVKGFVSDEELQLLYNQCKLSVVPLRYGAGVKGKVIEALYNGIPIVTTSIGAEGIIDIEKLVAIDDEEQAFADDVLSLYEDNDTLKQMAENSQIYIKQRYSVDAAWSIIEEDFS